MSRMRTLADLRNNNSADNEVRPLVNNRQSSFRTSQQQPAGPKNAREENFFQALHVNLCPKFSVFSVLFWLSIIQIVVYTVELSIGGISNKSFLAADSATLEDMGEKHPYKMRYEWELHRYIMPIFLHGDLGHLMSNLIAQLMIGSNLEPDIGALKFFTLYILSGIGGVVFSALCSDTLSMGASTAVFGLSGCYIAFVIINYEYLSQRPQKMCQIVMWIVLSLLLTIMLGSKNVDVLGHLGGFITGAIVGLWVLPCLEQSQAKKDSAAKIGSIAKIATAAWFVIMLTFFYTLRTPVSQIGGLKASSLPAKEITPSSSTEISSETSSETPAAAESSPESTPVPEPATETAQISAEITDEIGNALSQVEADAEVDEWLAQTYAENHPGQL